MNKRYQKKAPKTSTGPGFAVPDDVTMAMGEIAEDMREGLLALAVGAGLQVMASLMEADVAAACGPRGRHDPERTAVRHGTERGSVTLGGRPLLRRRALDRLRQPVTRQGAPLKERPARTQQVRHRPREGMSHNTRPLKIPARARHTQT